VPEIWLATFELRQDRELARLRLHLVNHRSMLEQRVHATLISFGKAVPGHRAVRGRRPALLADLAVPAPWRSTVDASLELIDDLESQIAALNLQLRDLRPDHPYIPTLMTAPEIGWVLA
jgi:transposase